MDHMYEFSCKNGHMYSTEIIHCMYLYIVYPYYSFFCCENHAAAKILDIKMSHVICVSGREIAGSKDIKVIDISEY